MAASRDEREMTIHQRGLVDTCFEEGLYDSGIAVLDQLRSPSFKPPAQVSSNTILVPDLIAFYSDHIRQLLYIALFPPPPATGDQITHLEQIPPSPIKGSPTRQKPTIAKASLSPSVTHSALAQRLLFSFLATNSPRSLFRALPRYPLDDPADNDLPPALNDNSHGEDSLISRESLCIKDCKHCWAILKDGFVQRKKFFPPDTSKKRGRAAYDVQDVVLDQGQGSGTQAVVAEHAWPVLEWLLSLFEKDECLNSHKSLGKVRLLDRVRNNRYLILEKFSLLLLSQIPPPRGSSGPRWEASAPLDIIFYAVRQDDGERRDMATRLLTLVRL